MTKRQRDDIVKLLYDLIKFTYTGFIIGGIISPKGLLWFHVTVGFVISALFLVGAYWLSRKEQ